MNRFRKAFWNCMCIMTLLILLSMIVSKIVTGWSSVFSYRVFFIMSESMEPEIYENQFVIGRMLSKDKEPETGEIYAYRRKGIIGEKIIIHRLVAVTDDGRYKFKGDNNEVADEELVDRGDVGYIIEIY